MVEQNSPSRANAPESPAAAIAGSTETPALNPCPDTVEELRRGRFFPEIPAPFQTHADENYLRRDEPEPALLVNPRASVLTVLGAAQRRAWHLRKALLAWTLVDECDAVSAGDIAQFLEPVAEEIELLLDAAADLSRSAA